MKFRKKPVEIDAIQWFPGIDIEGVREVEAQLHVDMGLYYPINAPRTILIGEKTIRGMINTLEGTMYASPGDWIITGVKGEKYACKPDIFEETYEKVEDNG